MSLRLIISVFSWYSSISSSKCCSYFYRSVIYCLLFRLRATVSSFTFFDRPSRSVDKYCSFYFVYLSCLDSFIAFYYALSRSCFVSVIVRWRVFSYSCAFWFLSSWLTFSVFGGVGGGGDDLFDDLGSFCDFNSSIYFFRLFV